MNSKEQDGAKCVLLRYIPPHKHEWDYTGTEVSDVDCYTPIYHEFECWNCGKAERQFL